VTRTHVDDGEPNGAPNGADGRDRVDGRNRAGGDHRAPRSERRRSVRQLLFVIAGAHTGGFVGSIVPTFGLPGGAASLGLVVVLFALPFLVDANWERIEAGYLRLLDRVE
jgi:hypothetical protein